MHLSLLGMHGGWNDQRGEGDGPVTKPKTKSILAAGTLALAVTASPAGQAPAAAAAPAAWSSAARWAMDEAPAYACPSSLAGGRAAPQDDGPDSGDGGESDDSGEDDGGSES